ncbi:MAG TPA: proprotein convertase P-domain-containing protein [Thermoanaerobaculia bacterium]|nr:proprotein convertase P-domain-containing protein [Thermoanaerobaculia bacterium]
MLLALLLSIATPDLRLELVRESLTGRHCRYREYVAGVATENFVTRDCPSSNLHPAFPRDAVNGNGDGQIKTARIFDPNPVAAINDPFLQDRNDSAFAVPEHAYDLVELHDVAASGPLRGPHVRLVDVQSPTIAPPDASQPLLFNRADDGFEDVNVYFHIDRNQRYLQSLGYTGERAVVPYAIEVDAHAAGGADNSFFVPSPTTTAIGTLFFGEGGTDDAEDADLVVHEYGHAILEWIAPGVYAGAFASESRALSEGFGDYWAYSAHVEQRLASGRDPFCFADWDARCWDDDPSQRCAYQKDSDCLRRLDSPRTMAQFERNESGGVEHRNGTIWSSALREIHQQLGRTITDTILVESLFGTPPRPTYAIAARRLLEADRLLYGGTHANVICGVMRTRGILGSCDDTPRGELTHFQSPEHALAIPEASTVGVTSTLTIDDPRAIERLLVRVDIAHPSRGDLRIDLVAPDGTAILLQQVSFERDADVRTTFGLTATPLESLDILRGRSAEGTWKLIVRDQRQRDVGTLLSWGLVIQFAGDTPSLQRPRALFRQTIPVVAHLFGANATRFASDVRIANVTESAQHATLIFTRSGADGTRDFATVHLVIAAGQTIAFDDVVESAFHTAGSGSLEILGDVLAMSRTYALTQRGTFAQQIPPHEHSTSLTEAPLLLHPLDAPDTRYNFGVTETAGEHGVVVVGERRVELAPFSHVQFPGEPRLVEVDVVSGGAAVVAYVSQVDNTSGDAMYVPATRLDFAPPVAIAPVITNDTWQSDLWIRAQGPGGVAKIDAIGVQQPSTNVTLTGYDAYADVLARLFHRTITTAALRVTLPHYAVAATRVRNGNVSQFIPLLHLEAGPVQHLPYVENASPYRTNVGIVSEAEAIAEVTVYDAAGAAVMRTTLATSGGFVQTPITARVVNGRAHVRFTAGRGRAYASVVDDRTGDATFVAGR